MKPQAGYLSMVAVLLITVVSFIGVSAAQLFSTDTRASTQRLQDTQALYLAEAGLQRGSKQWFDNQSYTGEGPTSLGAGTFKAEIYTTDFSGNALAANQRRVRGIGEAGNSKRIMESIIQTADNAETWVVGYPSSGELIGYYDASSWSRSGPYSDPPNVRLNDIYCVAADDCWAVGDFYEN